MTRKLSCERRKRFRRMLFGGREWVECHYCGARLTESSVTLDHVVPLSRGGEMGIRNIVMACQKCNQRRGNWSYSGFVRRLRA